MTPDFPAIAENEGIDDLVIETENDFDAMEEEALFEDDLTGESFDKEELESAVDEAIFDDVTDTDGMFSLKKEYAIQTSNDDCLVGSSSVNCTSSGVYLHGLYSSNNHQDNYLRFVNIDLPEDAVISQAYLSFTVRDASTKPTTFQITGEMSSGDPFGNNVASFNDRTFTETYIEMSTPDSIKANDIFETEDIKSVINEMRQNHTDLNQYVFKLVGSGVGTAIMRSYNSSATRAPKLVIEYYSSRHTEEYMATSTSDSAEEYGTNHTVSTSNAVRIGGYRSTTLNAANKQVSGFRFQNVSLPQEAEIVDAYMEFTVSDTTSRDVESNMVIRSEIGDAVAYETRAYNISNRSYSQLSVDYQQSAFKTTRQIVRTPNLKNLVDENRLSGWQSGQSMAFMIDGDNYIGSVYRASSSYAPKLVIEYQCGTGELGIDGVPDKPEQLKNVYINEVSNGTDSSEDPWMELYNDNDYPVILSKGVFITDDSNLDKYELNNMLIPAKGFRILYLNSENHHLSTNFTLDNTGGTLTLSAYYHNTYHTLDQFQYQQMKFNETYGRFTDGNPEIVKYKIGTFSGTNNDMIPEMMFNVNKSSGHYDDPFDLEITTDSINTIKYTLDDTIPSETNGFTYDGPISIDKSQTLKIYIYNAKQNSGVITYVYMIGQSDLELKNKKVEYTIGTGYDDLYATATAVSLTNSRLYLDGKNGSTELVTYLRFTGIELPVDAVISNAYLTFTTKVATSKPTSLTVTGEIGEGQAFTSNISSVNGRTFTSSAVTSRTPDSIALNEKFHTEDLTNVIKEMRSYNADSTNYVFKIEGDRVGTYTAQSYEGSRNDAAKLVIEYFSGYDAYEATIDSRTDTAEEYGNNRTVSTSSAVRIGGYRSTTLNAANKQISGFRFQNVELPQEAEIEEAYIEMTVSATTSRDVVANMIIRSEIGDAAAYATRAYNISDREYSQLSVTYQQPAFQTTRQVVRTPNLKDLIDENRLSGWQSGQSLAFMFDGDNYIGSVYQGATSYSPKLIIKYKYSGEGAFINGAITDPAKIEKVFINEVGAEGTTSSKESWIELYNDNEVPVILSGGTYLSNDANKLEKHEFDNLVIAAKGFRVITDEAIESQNNYAALSLKSAGEIFLSTIQSNQTNDEVAPVNLVDHLIINQIYGGGGKGDTPISHGFIELYNPTNQEIDLSGYEISYMSSRGSSHAGNTDGVAHKRTLEGTLPARTSYLIRAGKEDPAANHFILDVFDLDWSDQVIDNKQYQIILSKGAATVDAVAVEEAPLEGDSITGISKQRSIRRLGFIDTDHNLADFEFISYQALVNAGDYHGYEAVRPRSVADGKWESTSLKRVVETIDSFKYQEHLYNQTYARSVDGGSDLVLFQEESYGESNSNGQLNYPITVSHDRGVYDTGFELVVTTPNPSVTLKYSNDGTTTPSQTQGHVYTEPITIDKTCVVKLYAYDELGNSGIITYTYVLKDNLKNEKTSGARWQYKNNINDEEYGEAMASFPIVSVTSESGKDLSSYADYVQSTVEYIDAHLGDGNHNFFTNAGTKKFGQASITQYNSNVNLRFHRNYNTKKVKVQVFDPIPDDPFPTPEKYGKLQLKEGQDGPQSDIYNLGYLRYDDKVSHTLGIQMQKFGLKTRYVQYFFNGTYRGVKTLREDFGSNTFENYFGDESDDYTVINFQDAWFTSGTVKSGDGNPALLTAIKKTATDKNFQEFKKYVDVEDFIKFQLLFMFIDTEREAEGILHNDAYNGNGIKMITNINDLDGAFYNNGRTGTTGYALAGGGGTYRFKWIDSYSRRGPGGWFAAFSGDSRTSSTAGNLEFKTLVKDQVLEQIGPASGDFTGAPGAPLSVENVQKVIHDNYLELDENSAYKVDAAYMGARRTIYQDWLAMQPKVQSQVVDRVKYSLEMWTAYGMAHTLEPVTIVDNGSGIVLDNPNNTDVYYTTDGSDPMGPEGTISSSAVKYTGSEQIDNASNLTVRPFTTNNWGPMTSK